MKQKPIFSCAAAAACALIVIPARCLGGLFGLATCALKKDLRTQVFFWRSQEKNPEPKLRVASRLGRLVKRPRFAIMFPPFIRGLHKNSVFSNLCGVHVTKVAV